MAKPLTITVTDNAELVLSLPPRLQRQAGIKTGDQMEVRVSSGLVTFIPKPPTANEEYTREQRRIINARLTEAEKGPFHGPFKSGDEAAAYLKTFKRQRVKSAKSKKPR